MDQRRVAVIGLGSMGLGMARSLRRAGLTVVGVDVATARLEAFAAEGGLTAATPREAAAGTGILVAVVINAAQAEAVLFGPEGAVAHLPPGAVVIASPTLPPDTARAIGARVEEAGLHYLDAPMSGGPGRAEEGQLTFMASGSAEAFARAQPALDAMAGRVYRLGDAPGAGSSMKLVNQLLAGTHLAAACEAMALAVRLGLDPQEVFEVISVSAGSSWMFQNRVPHILAGDYRPASAVSIFTKDLGIVLDTARAKEFPVPVAGAALQMFLMAAAMGMAGDDDASVARVYARLADLDLPETKP